jgi:hypothetical protein
MTNVHAKICAKTVVALVQKLAPNPAPEFASTC